MAPKVGSKNERKKNWTMIDYVLFLILTTLAICILFPFYNVIILSVTKQTEYLVTPFLLFPRDPTLETYKVLFED